METKTCLLLILWSTIAVLQAGEHSRPARRPVAAYINWAAYDELSDNVELTEQLAIRQLGEVVRLRRAGVRIDYYVNDAFWFAKDGGYRRFRTPHWPKGPDAWLEACRRNGLLPGLWIGTNTLSGLTPIPEWEDSLNRQRNALCLFEGGFLPHLIGSLQHWYDRGVRMYKFDFANFAAATPAAEKKYTPEEIVRRNMDAFRNALFAFREKNPEAVLIAYNGFGADMKGTAAPFRKSVDLRWLDVFDSLYSGDPRPADVPAMNFWRSKDIYSDHMVRRFEQDNFPLERIDNSAFMIGTTGTCYNRRTSAWKGMLLLSLARGGWVNTYYGNLELLSEGDAGWFAKAQRMFLPLQELGRVRTFGGIPGEGKPYGFAAAGETGAFYTVVNPAQSNLRLDLPAKGKGRLLFRDAGFVPVLSDGAITLGAEQMAVVGFGKYADAAYDLGVQEDVPIPTRIHPLPALFEQMSGSGEMTGTVSVPWGEDLRIIMRQLGPDGLALRSTGGAPPKGTTMGQLFRITATQDGKSLPVEIRYDKAIWSGMSWAVGEIKASDLAPGKQVTVRCSTQEKKEHRLNGEAFGVAY